MRSKSLMRAGVVAVAGVPSGASYSKMSVCVSVVMDRKDRLLGSNSPCHSTPFTEKSLWESTRPDCEDVRVDKKLLPLDPAKFGRSAAANKVGAMSEDLARAIDAARLCDRADCTKYGMQFTWEAATEQFRSGLVTLQEDECISLQSAPALEF